jgi:inosose dehydratase
MLGRATGRRQFLGALMAMGGMAAIARAEEGRQGGDRPIACNSYPWTTFFQREGRQWEADLDRSLGEFARSGLRGYEPLVRSADQIAVLRELLPKHGLRMDSLYVASTLHEPEAAERSIETVLRIAEAARQLGTGIIVTNPDPLPARADKTDAQLDLQARQLDRLGAEVRRLGLVLAYHNHDPEMRQAAREYHHMLLATRPEHVSLCLEPHWIYRGAGNSQVALFDLLKLYAPRVVSVHLRQSEGGVWTEVFGPGDIDYARLAGELAVLERRPLLVLEQPVERGTPHTLGPVEAHRRGLLHVQEVLGVRG